MIKNIVEGQFKSRIPLLLQPTDFEEVEIDRSLLRKDPRLLDADISCISFVIRKRERHYVFAQRFPGRIRYTRPKEGYLPALVSALSIKDFNFHCNGTLHTRGNVCAKLCEVYLNFHASVTINNHIKEYADRVGVTEFSVGFKVSYYDYYNLTFNADFELVIKSLDKTFERYRGTFINGKFNNMVTEKFGSPCSMIDVFNHAIL